MWWWRRDIFVSDYKSSALCYSLKRMFYTSLHHSWFGLIELSIFFSMLCWVPNVNTYTCISNKKNLQSFWCPCIIVSIAPALFLNGSVLKYLCGCSAMRNHCFSILEFNPLYSKTKHYIVTFKGHIFKMFIIV